MVYEGEEGVSWADLEMVAAKVLGGTVWSGERALCRVFWACLSAQRLTQFSDEFERQYVLARFVAIILLLDEVDALCEAGSGDRYILDELTGEMTVRAHSSKRRDWNILVSGLDWNFFRIGQLVGLGFSADTDRAGHPHSVVEEDDIQLVAIRVLGEKMRLSIIAALVLELGSREALIACLVGKDDEHDFLDLVDDVADGRHGRASLRPSWVAGLRARLFEESTPETVGDSPTLGGKEVEKLERVLSLSGQLALFPPDHQLSDELRWQDVLVNATDMFSYWCSDAGIHFGRLAWRALRRSGLTWYSNDLDRHRVVIRFLALGWLYQRFAAVAWDESDDSSVDLSGDWAEGLELSSFRLGQLAGLQEDLSDDPEEAEQEALHNMAYAELSVIVPALARGFGSWTALLGALTESEEMEDFEWALVTLKEYASIKRPNISDYHVARAYEWLRGI